MDINTVFGRSIEVFQIPIGTTLKQSMNVLRFVVKKYGKMSRKFRRA
jgi:hypothetical protein